MGESWNEGRLRIWEQQTREASLPSDALDQITERVLGEGPRRARQEVGFATMGWACAVAALLALGSITVATYQQHRLADVALQALIWTEGTS